MRLLNKLQFKNYLKTNESDVSDGWLLISGDVLKNVIYLLVFFRLFFDQGVCFRVLKFL